ncbi:MAG: radical SAM protein [Candidatus Syntropharchaeia archaeon]
MFDCSICGKEGVSGVLSICVDCIREGHLPEGVHSRPPRTEGGSRCRICSNKCSMGDGERGYCGLRERIKGKMKSLVSPNLALGYAYLDRLPTNCCASWFCPGSSERGYNLATFFYGCNFDCLFCQNSSHKHVESAPIMEINEFVRYVKSRDDIRCICYFGGSPEPQLPFAIKASKKVIEERKVRICWEWNGCGNPGLVKKAAEISVESEGIVKFDLKAFDPNLSIALSGVSNEMAYRNFEMIASTCGKEVLTATTLLVPNYVDSKEVEGIARFIAGIDPDIPYSLLVFHPDYRMSDLPITPSRQVKECYAVAKEYLNRVNIGNRHLLID